MIEKCSMVANENGDPLDGRGEVFLRGRYRVVLMIPMIESALGIMMIGWIGVSGIGFSGVQNLASPATLVLAGLALLAQSAPFVLYFCYFREYRR